jgi:hypothetical protein
MKVGLGFDFRLDVGISKVKAGGPRKCMPAVHPMDGF